MNPIGIVVNPKLNEPLLVVYESGDYELLRMVEGWPLEGRGALDSDDAATYITGLPRSHTPSGLKTKGKGYGTALYTGLCLGAHQGNEGAIDDSDATGDGISSSEDNRSTSASEWWSRAVDLGLADRIEDEIEDIATYDDLSVGDLNNCIEVPDGGEVRDVRALEVDIVRKRVADAYRIESAWEGDLIPAFFHLTIQRQQLNTLWKMLAEHADGAFDGATAEQLLALDVRGISQQAMHLISVCAKWAGADADALDAIYVRWQLGLDPEEPIRQQTLPFKKNSSEMRTVLAANEQAAELRRQLDWKKFAALP